ncbi:hypothetical protein BRD56_01900 [Thermoplasmatales archaeon SW_10_69_26]|nr:MAG: hypothetical protein BRD56_01900 [Thermoplasmatales archaeon SW_10_69_26]
MLDLGWHALEQAREAYLAYALLTDGEAEWYRLDYPVQLEVPYDPNDLEDPDYTTLTTRERELRQRLVDGDRAAFAEILNVADDEKRRQLADHPALAWRLENL